jgi:hypothetical protein
MSDAGTTFGEVPRQRNSVESWRTGCPEGHVSCTNRVTKDGYYCDTCGEFYKGEQIPRGGNG